MRLPALIALAAVVVGSRAAVPITKFASPVMDFHVRTAVEARDMDALKVISPEFAQSYRFSGSEIYYKEPGKLKVVSKAGLIDVTYKINGNSKAVQAGLIHKTIDITHSPGQRQGAMSVGLLTPSWLSLVSATLSGTSKVDGISTVVFEAHYNEEPGGTYYKFYIDPARKFTCRQEQFHGDGKLKLTTRFLEPVKINGVWIPTKTIVSNAAGKQGAVTKLNVISVNSGLSDKDFEL